MNDNPYSSGWRSAGDTSLRKPLILSAFTQSTLMIAVMARESLHLFIVKHKTRINDAMRNDLCDNSDVCINQYDGFALQIASKSCAFTPATLTPRIEGAPLQS